MVPGRPDKLLCKELYLQSQYTYIISNYCSTGSVESFNKRKFVNFGNEITSTAKSSNNLIGFISIFYAYHFNRIIAVIGGQYLNFPINYFSGPLITSRNFPLLNLNFMTVLSPYCRIWSVGIARCDWTHFCVPAITINWNIVKPSGKVFTYYENQLIMTTDIV